VLTTRTDGGGDTGQVDLGVHADYPPSITDVYWDETTTSVVVTFTSAVGEDYTIETVDAAAYDDTLTWADGATVTASAGTTTVSDDLSTTPLTDAFRFYRVKRTDGSDISAETVGVFELSLGSTPSLSFIATPLVPDADHASAREIFGEGASRQIPRNGFQVTDLNEVSGGASRLRLNLGGTFDLIAGSEFDIEVCAGYEVFMGFGPPSSYTVRLTGYVSGDAPSMDLTKAGAQSLRWTAYSMPRSTTLDDLGLQTAVVPWNALNRVRLLPLGASSWTNYNYIGGQWVNEGSGLPENPTLACGEGIVFMRFGPPDMDDELELEPWYVDPPNE
jgi:hypothetical protein